MIKWFKRKVCKYLGHRWLELDFLIIGGDQHITVHVTCRRCTATTTINKLNEERKRIWRFEEYLR